MTFLHHHWPALVAGFVTGFLGSSLAVWVNYARALKLLDRHTRCSTNGIQELMNGFKKHEKAEADLGKAIDLLDMVLETQTLSQAAKEELQKFVDRIGLEGTKP